jgi:hypothetical protein
VTWVSISKPGMAINLNTRTDTLKAKGRRLIRMGASQTASGNLNDRGLDRENISTPVEAEPFSREPKRGAKADHAPR